jgi:hypothetical protein
VTEEPTPEEPKQTFRISWFSADGKELLQESVVEEGTLPAYTGPTPTLPADMGFADGIRSQYIPGSLTKARLYNYTFAGWTPALAEADGDAEYTANFAAGETLEFPENYYDYGAFVYRVMDSVPMKRPLAGEGIGGNVNVFIRRIQIKAKMGYGPGYTLGEEEVWRNAVVGEGIFTLEGYLIGRTSIGNWDVPYSSTLAQGDPVHIEGQLFEAGIFYFPANYQVYRPDDPYADACYGYQGIPLKATTPVIEGKVLGITESKGDNAADRDAPQIVYTRRVSIDTNNDGREDECMTLCPVFVTHREMFDQIRAGDDISFRIHESVDMIGSNYVSDIRNGRVFPEDVESYGDYINDRDFIYKWATGNPAANGDNFQTIELVNAQLVDGYQSIYLGDKYTGKASSLKH